MASSPRQTERNQKRAAAQARWSAEAAAKHEWQTMPLEDAKRHLAELRSEAELAAQIIQQRLRESAEDLKCVICSIPIRGVPASIITVRDVATGIYSNDYYCSAECVARKQQRQTGLLSLTH